jgi:hypothetical protein
MIVFFRRILFMVVVITVATGCIWIDDDDDGCCCCDIDEHIIYINHTGYTVDNYIDSEYVGTVPGYGDLSLWGDFEGPYEYYSECADCDDAMQWGPTTFDLDDGEVFRIYLEPGDWACSRVRVSDDIGVEVLQPSF